jgi:hypothetical protein
MIKTTVQKKINLCVFFLRVILRKIGTGYQQFFKLDCQNNSVFSKCPTLKGGDVGMHEEGFSFCLNRSHSAVLRAWSSECEEGIQNCRPESGRP